MNVLHLQPFLDLTNGVSKAIYLLTKYSGCGIKSSVLSFGGDAVTKYQKENLTVEFIPGKKNIRNIIKHILYIKTFCLKNKIDIIHSHHRYFDLLSYIISKQIKIKTITTVHSKVYGKKYVSYKSDYLIAVSDSIKKHLVGYFKIKEDKIYTINNFVDPKEKPKNFNSSELLKQLNIELDNIVLVFIGRFSKEKGVDILLEAFKDIQFNHSNAILLLVGNGEEIASIKKYYSKFNLKVKIIAPVENIYDYYNIADIIILPSRVDPFPFIMLEAGLMKKPLIASRVDGIAEFIEHDVNGILVEPENVLSLVEGLKRLIDNPSLRIKLSENLNKKVLDGFTLDKIIPRYREFYRSLL